MTNDINLETHIGVALCMSLLDTASALNLTVRPASIFTWDSAGLAICFAYPNRVFHLGEVIALLESPIGVVTWKSK